MKVIYSGPTGSGKTTKLREKYGEIGREKGTDNCLVFVKNASSVGDWRSKVALEMMGPLHVYTYFGFVQKEVANYWPWIEAALPGGMVTLEPTFMNVETAHYLMSKFVEIDRGQKEVFDYLNATSAQIAVQLIDNLNQAAMNCLDFSGLKERLLDWVVDDQEKIMIFNETIAVMERFRKFCLSKRIIDYSLMVDLYNKYLLNNEDYLKELYTKYRYLWVDNLEKTVPAAQSLFLKILKEAAEAYLAFNPEGGVNLFFGGNLELARENFFPLCKEITLDVSYTSSKEARELSRAIEENVFEGKSSCKLDFIMGELNTELRGDVLLKAAEKVSQLIEEGVAPDQIAFIAPLVDKVLEFTLERYFKKRGYGFINLTRSKRLVDIPFAQALITLTLMVNPDWKLPITYSALQQTLSLILKLDPVRSALISEEIFKNAFKLPDLDETGLRAKIGFEKAERYNYLRDWLAVKEKEQLAPEQFFQVVFTELLAPLSPTAEDILACRQMIDSITKFEKVLKNYQNMSEEEIGRCFIDMIYNGTLAAEVLYDYTEKEKSIILATPYRFLFSPQLEKVEYLFLLDLSSEKWFRSISKELTNPYILSPRWRKEMVWDDEIDQKVRTEQLVDYLQSILSKCTKGVYLVDSYLNSSGWEQEGRLIEWLQPMDKVVKSYDQA